MWTAMDTRMSTKRWRWSAVVAGWLALTAGLPLLPLGSASARGMGTEVRNAEARRAPAARTADRGAALATEIATEIDPPIEAVLAAAYAVAGLDHDSRRSWIRRARLSGLVPWVTVRTTRDTSWQDQQSEVGHGTTVELRATWRLDRLLFDSRELQVAGIEASRRRERHRLAMRVIRAYFAWRRARTQARQTVDDDRLVSRVDEAAAELDALTDGWFSRQRSRPASGGAGSAKP